METGLPIRRFLWGLEKNKDAVESSKSGKIIDPSEGGIYSDNGFKVEFTGSIMNQLASADSSKSTDVTSPVDNFSNSKDVDASANNGNTSYTLTFKFPADKPELSAQVSLNPVSGNFSISQATMRFNVNGQLTAASPVDSTKTVNIAYESVSAPELMIGNTSTSLANVDVNKYFTNSCVKSLYNYRFSDTSANFSVKTPPGRGQVLCLGAPIFNISFLCFYPNNDNLPKEAYEDYTLNLTEARPSSTTRSVAMDYNLLRSKPLNLSTSSYAIMSVRVKFIDATPALAMR